MCGIMISMAKASNRSRTAAYIVRARDSRKKVDWRDYIIPTKSKKKRRVSEMVDKIVYGI